MRIEMRNLGEFESAMERLIRRVHSGLGDGLTQAAEDVGQAFRQRARRLSGAHADSYTVEPARSSGDRVTVRAGPTMPYSRKISLRFGDLAEAVADAAPRAMTGGVVDAYTRVVR